MPLGCGCVPRTLSWLWSCALVCTSCSMRALSAALRASASALRSSCRLALQGGWMGMGGWMGAQGTEGQHAAGTRTQWQAELCACVS
jgi:hypothetical protein